MEIILEDKVANDKKFWNVMFKIINESYRIEYIIHKKKNYFNCSSSRYEGDKILNKMIQNNIKPAHKDHICKCNFNYDDDIIHKKYNKRKVNPEEIKYVYTGKFELNIMEDYKKFLLNNNKLMNMYFHDYFHSGNFNLDDLYNKDDLYLFGSTRGSKPTLTNKYDKTIGLCAESKKIILDIYNDNSIDKSNIKFISNIDIIITNVNGFNYDYRGLSHTLIELPFLTDIDLGKEFTLEDLIITITNLKSHKFDYWYELYTDCSCEYENEINSIIINLEFDHGS